MLVSPTIDPTERSIPRVMMTKVMPTTDHRVDRRLQQDVQDVRWLVEAAGKQRRPRRSATPAMTLARLIHSSWTLFFGGRQLAPLWSFSDCLSIGTLFIQFNLLAGVFHKQIFGEPRTIIDGLNQPPRMTPSRSLTAMTSAVRRDHQNGNLPLLSDASVRGSQTWRPRRCLGSARQRKIGLQIAATER